ncbi:alpha-glucuronidase family glycosyl hydrolase [Pedobacter nyackensis]|uniref:alpha-d-galacturonidase n=1 Tax=Pedobacter nyackensis TaxID=475255 RepID=UPI00292CF4CD|nr:alpha-glucuronidase family glycosyl hydrolase [Pedobacter nyackensis]
MRKIYAFIFLSLLLTASTVCFASEIYKKNKRTIVIPLHANPRLKFGADRLAKSLSLIGYDVKIVQKDKVPNGNEIIVIGTKGDQLLAGLSVSTAKQVGKEGFTIGYNKNRNLVIEGADHSGALYGCMELVDEIKVKNKLPEDILITDQPQMVLRGTCIGLQKTDFLPGREIYEYPYTPESFPWFYDKDHWVRYLDMMVENRYNSLYLWNGHPFSSLVRLKDYPYAVEVDDETFKKNEEVFKFLTEEADKRGIWVIQMFYNIIIPKPFADKHGLKTQDRNRPIIPLIADYTRKSIAAFVEKYPNVGLLVALGEAMEGVGQDDIDWFTKTIIPGVKDGLKAAGIKEEPPIVLRAHDTHAPSVMAASLPLYKNLYTENKFNGEALTTYTPRGSWAELHRELSRVAPVHISNVHILANLEPFRYGSADFIQKSVQAMDKIYGSKGLHLYPQSGYWDWPYTADKINERQLQIDRDWIWYKEWGRYAWNSYRDRNEEINYWGKELGDKYGTDLAAGKAILNAYEESGEISPKLLRRYGITDGNRQTLTLGMLMTQLINPYRYGLFTLMYESEAPEGEMIIEYAEKAWKKEGHIGETPVQVAKEVIEHGKKALISINEAAPSVTKDTAEFRRLRNDMHCYDAMANFYAEKVKSALWVLRYKYSNDITDLEKALPLLEKSVAHYAELVKLTQNDYLYANSMQTKQRKIPMRGVDKTFIHWKEMLPVFTRELNHFKRSIDSLKVVSSGKINALKPYTNAEVKVLSANGTYIVDKGIGIFTDSTAVIKEVTEKLKGLKGVKLNKEQQIRSGTTLEFSNKAPVKVLVGYFNVKGPQYLKAPELETDASANNYGQSEIKILNALVLDGYPPVNIHAYSFPAGTNILTLGKGACMILGFINEKEEMRIFNAGLDGNGKDIDWLFE